MTSDEERERLEAEAQREAEELAARRAAEWKRRGRIGGADDEDGYVTEFPEDLPDTKDIGTLALHVEEEIFATLYGLMKNPKVPPTVRKSCCDALLDRAKGKAATGVVDAGVKPGRELTAENLEKLLVAQVGDEQCAAWFGFDDVEDFLDVVEADGGLNGVYQRGRKVGQVEFLVNQWAMGKVDRNLNVWVGKQNLGQSDKVEQIVKIERVEVNSTDAAKAYQKLLSGGMPILDAEFTDITVPEPDGKPEPEFVDIDILPDDDGEIEGIIDV